MSLLEQLFHNFPSDSKPPFITKYEYNKSHDVIGATIQFALAGCKRDDIEVSIDGGRYLVIKANNLKNKKIISDKFQLNFNWRLAVTEKLDVDNCDISFEDGLLTIYLPVKTACLESKVIF